MTVESANDPKLSLALPEAVENWSLTTLRENLIKIGAKVVRHGRYATFQLAEDATRRTLFAESPSTAESATIFGPLEALSGKPRFNLFSEG